MTALIGLGAVFTPLFVALGPLKIVGPFVQLMRDADKAERDHAAFMNAIRRGRIEVEM